jgi:hypothetical protein
MSTEASSFQPSLIQRQGTRDQEVKREGRRGHEKGRSEEGFLVKLAAGGWQLAAGSWKL